MASPKFGSWWVLWIRVCPWWSYESVFARGSFVHQKCSNYALTNSLFGLCRSAWIINLLVILLSPYPGAPPRPSTPKVLRAKEHTSTPSPSVVFTFKLTIESIKEFGGASYTNMNECRWMKFIHHCRKPSICS
jgi:hypothetical protein